MSRSALLPATMLSAIMLALTLVSPVGAPAANGVGTSAAADDDCKLGTYVADPPPALRALQSDQAWKYATGRGITVAIVDSGIDARNVHLEDAVIGGVNLVGDGGSPRGLTDLVGHGTAIAGEIAAQPVEGSGVVGLARDAKLLSVRVFRGQDKKSVDDGYGPTAERIAAGIRWAADHGATIINVSLSDFAEGASLRDAVDYASRHGALVVASAGNRGTTDFTEDSIRYPAGYPGVLGVAATDQAGVVTDASIHGPQVAVAAPGVNIVTSGAGVGDCIYATDEASTSFATGYASAAAALVAEAHPDETPAQWKYRLEATALRVNPDARDDQAGWGVIQPYNAITLVPSASTRGPESPFSDTTGSAVTHPELAVEPHASESPLAPTREAMAYLAVGAASLLGVLGVLIVLRRRRVRP